MSKCPEEPMAEMGSADFIALNTKRLNAEDRHVDKYIPPTQFDYGRKIIHTARAFFYVYLPIARFRAHNFSITKL